MTTAREQFSKHFDHCKTRLVTLSGDLGKYLARFAQVHASRSHQTKQLNTLINIEFSERVKAYDTVVDLAKEMGKTAEALGYEVAAEGSAFAAVTQFRKEAHKALREVLVEWHRHNTEAWVNDGAMEMLRFAAEHNAAIQTALKHLADAAKAFRVAMTAHLKSAAFKAAAARPEYVAKLEQITNEIAARLAAEMPSAPKAKRARTTKETALGDEDSVAEGIDEEEAIDDGVDDSADDSKIFVRDDAPVVYEKTILDDSEDAETIDSQDTEDEESSDAFDPDEPEPGVASTSTRTRPERSGKRKAIESIRAQVAAEREIRRRHLEMRGVAAGDIDSGDDGDDDESVEVIEVPVGDGIEEVAAAVEDEAEDGEDGEDGEEDTKEKAPIVLSPLRTIPGSRMVVYGHAADDSTVATEADV